LWLAGRWVATALFAIGRIAVAILIAAGARLPWACVGTRGVVAAWLALPAAWWLGTAQLDGLCDGAWVWLKSCNDFARQGLFNQFFDVFEQLIFVYTDQ
jgi:hypothetical protein